MGPACGKVVKPTINHPQVITILMGCINYPQLDALLLRLPYATLLLRLPYATLATFLLTGSCLPIFFGFAVICLRGNW